MVEVFKTNVTEPHQADLLIRQIQKDFVDCEASFDLEDCDRILRVKSPDAIASDELVKLMGSWGFYAEVLADEIPSMQPQLVIHR